jgi:hypothetical protein
MPLRREWQTVADQVEQIKCHASHNKKPSWAVVHAWIEGSGEMVQNISPDTYGRHNKWTENIAANLAVYVRGHQALLSPRSERAANRGGGNDSIDEAGGINSEHRAKRTRMDEAAGTPGTRAPAVDRNFSPAGESSATSTSKSPRKASGPELGSHQGSTFINIQGRNFEQPAKWKLITVYEYNRLTRAAEANAPYARGLDRQRGGAGLLRLAGGPLPRAPGLAPRLLGLLAICNPHPLDLLVLTNDHGGLQFLAPFAHLRQIVLRGSRGKRVDDQSSCH